jgi:hypothetical protein
LAFLHDEKSTHEPQEKNHQSNDASTDACASRIARHTTTITTSTAASSAEQPIQTLIEVAPQLVKIRRTIVRPFVISPRFLLAVLRPTSPPRVVERKFQTEFFKD